MLSSVKELYIYGPGPSSSHTIGPYKATIDFINNYVNKFNIDKIDVTLFGSLALTGKGHLTDEIIINTLRKSYDKSLNVIFNYSLNTNLIHPNTLLFEGYKDDEKIISVTYFSLGGGAIAKNSLDNKESFNKPYPFNSFKDIKEYALNNNITDLSQIINIFEDKDIDEYLNDILYKMLNSVKEGLEEEGVLPGKLKLKRVAKDMFNNINYSANDEERVVMLLTSFAYAVSENNASGKMVVTAPTCGSSGIIPSILYYFKYYKNISDIKLINALKVGSLFGILAKENASISGAVSGCQAEIGVASAMGAAIYSYLNDLDIYKIEYAAELALEHFLGLTCDPVEGYVQIPCIERNGIGVVRSYIAYIYSKNISILKENRVSFDDCLITMKRTGDDLNPSYKETSIGGLAKTLKKEG